MNLSRDRAWRLRRVWEAHCWLVVTVTVALAAVLVRIPGVYDRPFWEDEVASARILREPTLGAMLHRVTQTESTPPFWYFVGWLVHRAGVPLQDERLLSVLFGGMFAALVAWLARRFVPIPLAALAGLMAALGAEFVWHGRELRAYELLALLSAIFGLCLLAELREPSRRTEVALAMTSAAGGLTHFFFAFSVLAALGWLWLDRGARHIRRRATLAVLAGGAVAAAWAPMLSRQYQAARFWWIGSFSVRYVIAVPLRLFTYAYTRAPVGPLLSAAAVAVLAIGCARLARSSAAGRLVVVLAVVPIVAAAAAWAGGMPIFALRNLIGVGAFVAVAAVAAVQGLPRRLVPAVTLTVAVGLVASLATSLANRTAPYDDMAQALVRDGWSASAPIAVFGDPSLYRGPLEWYLPRQPVLDVSRPLHRVCAEIFVVEHNGRVVRLRVHIPVSSVRQLRRATLLVDPAHRPSCVRLRGTRRTGTVA